MFGFNPQIMGLGWTLATGANFAQCTGTGSGAPPTSFAFSPDRGLRDITNGRMAMSDTGSVVMGRHPADGGGTYGVDSEIGAEPSKLWHPFKHARWAKNRDAVLARRRAIIETARRQEETRLRNRLIGSFREVFNTGISPFVEDVMLFNSDIQSGHLFVADEILKGQIADVAAAAPSLRDALGRIEHRPPREIPTESLRAWLEQAEGIANNMPAILAARRDIQGIQEATSAHLSRLARFLNVPSAIVLGEVLKEEHVIRNLRSTWMDFNDPDRMQSLRNAMRSTGCFAPLISLVDRHDDAGSGYVDPWAAIGRKISDATQDLSLIERYIAFIFVGASIGIHPRRGDGIAIKDGEGMVRFAERISDSRISAKWIHQMMKTFNLGDKFTTWDGETALEDPLSFGSANRAWISSDSADANEPYARIVDSWLYNMGAMEHDPRVACGALKGLLDADRELSDVIAAKGISFDKLKARCGVPSPHTSMSLVGRIVKSKDGVGAQDRREAMVKHAVDGNRHKWLSLENVAPIAIEMRRTGGPSGRRTIVNYPYRIVHAETPNGLIIGVLRVTEGKSMTTRSAGPVAGFIGGAGLEAQLYSVDPETWNTTEIMRKAVVGRDASDAKSYYVPVSISEGNRAVMEIVPEITFDGKSVGLKFQVITGFKSKGSTQQPTYRTIEIFGR